MKPEYTERIEDTKQELLNIRKWINTDRNRFDSKSKYLVAYGVVKSCGTTESIYKHLIFDYLTIGAKFETETYLEKMILDSSSNPNTGNISNLLQNVSQPWKTRFDQEVNVGNVKSDLNSLVQLRNDFAHGKSITVSIDTVQRYFDSAAKVLELLDDIVK